MPSAALKSTRATLGGTERSTQRAPRRIDSSSLMGGDNLLMIEHAGCSYYLRMTRNNKLILTK